MSFTIPCQVLEKHKEAEDMAVDHSSRFENPHMEVLTEGEIADKFFDQHLMVLKSKFNNDEPWYADFLCTDNIMRRCVAGSETLKILAHCHSGPTGGHHSASVTAKKVYESGFYWPSVFKDANEYVCEVFDVWGLDFMGPFPESRGNKYILVAVDYVSKWVEAQALPTNDARVMVKFLRSLFARFGVPKALISDRGTHFCNSQLEKALQRYGRDQWGTILKLNELAELRDDAYENTRIYKERTKKWHDSRLHGDKDFKVGDQVLLFNSRLKMYPGKLKSKWSDPNIVKTVYPHGAMEITDRDGFSFKVNGQRLKKYYEGNIDKEDDEVIEFENGDAILRILGFRIWRIDPCTDLAETKSTNWWRYTLKMTCVELIRHSEALVNTPFAQELNLENHPEQNIKGMNDEPPTLVIGVTLEGGQTSRIGTSVFVDVVVVIGVGVII
ncbi:reverse transcriptase domain-containing protein [Tanacetum coccineum]